MILDDKGEVVSTKFGYEGSQAVSRHRNWLSTTSPVDISEEQVLPFAQRNTLVSHLYELYRNDPVCFAIVESIVTNVASPKLISNTGDDEYDAEKERLFARWFNNCETTGFSLPEVLRLVLRELCLAGEVFLMLGPSKLMLIEANRIASDPKNKKKQEHVVSCLCARTYVLRVRTYVCLRRCNQIDIVRTYHRMQGLTA